MSELIARAEAARAIAEFDTTAIVDAAVAMGSDEFLVATSAFVPPPGSLSEDELAIAAAQTAAAITAIEAQLAAVALELDQLHQAGNSAPRETGTRVDFAG